MPRKSKDEIEAEQAEVDRLVELGRKVWQRERRHKPLREVDRATPAEPKATCLQQAVFWGLLVAIAVLAALVWWLDFRGAW